MTAENQPNYYIRGPRPERDLGAIHGLSIRKDEHIPASLEEAAEFVLLQQPAEVAAYAGSLVIQQAVAQEIAETIFRIGEPINPRYFMWLNGDEPTEQLSTELKEEVLQDYSRLPQSIGLVATRTLEEQREVIANTRYVPSSTPIEPQTARNGRPVEILTTGVL